jgi:predicted nucleic acid-binding protein
VKLLFVDTGGWIACADAADPDHEVACGARDNWLEHQGLLITSDYVIDETLTLLRLRLGLSAAEQWWDAIAASKRLIRELIHEERAERARHIFFRHRDKNFSFTDCTSFALMRELKIREALTTDKHFRQAGFQMFLSG